eukprot:241650_1
MMRDAIRDSVNTNALSFKQRSTSATIFDDESDSNDDVNLSIPETVEFADLSFFPPFKGIRHSIYQLLSDPTSSILSLLITTSITILIIASCVTFVLESMPKFKFPEVGSHEDDTLPFFANFESIAIYIFTVEYGLRLFTAHAVEYELLSVEYEKYNHIQTRCPRLLHKTWLFFKQPFNIIDFLAVVPFYVSIAQFSFLRILRLARVFRVFKLGKYTEGAILYSEVFRKSAQALYLLVFFSIITSVVFGSFIYNFEKGHWVVNGCIDHYAETVRSCFMRDNIIGDKLVESPFYSIPQAIWWVFTTIATVGYGDIYPTSFMGKFIAIITMHVGILGLALPISIIGTNFREIWDIRQQIKYDERIKSRFENAESLQLMNDMKKTLQSIMMEVKHLQTTMIHYEQIMKDKDIQFQEIIKSPIMIESQPTIKDDIRKSLNNFVHKLKVNTTPANVKQVQITQPQPRKNSKSNRYQTQCNEEESKKINESQILMTTDKNQTIVSCNDSE